MGVTFIEGTMTGPTGERATVEFLVDSGATYTLLPQDVWQKLGLVPQRSIRCRLADGSVVEREVSECHISLPQGQRSTPVMLGKPGDAALLGVLTLEELGLIINPFTRELQPMQMMLM